MISTEEKIEIMQRERIAYKKGFRDGIRWAVAVVVIGSLICVCAAIILIIV